MAGCWRLAGSSPTCGNTASAELYDPSSGTWATTGTMISIHISYADPATLLLDGRVLVAGGGVDGRAAEVYDPSTGSWAATGDMVITVTASPRATLLLDGRVLVTGVTSVGEPFASAAQLYDPANGSWSLTGTPIEPRFAYLATRLNDGKVLVAGGAVGGVVQLTSAELYDPISGSWTATGRLVNPHADGHTATLLPDGKVLVAGGYDSLTGADLVETMTSAELYDPRTESWTATGSLNWGHGFETAILLPNGEVLVVGDTYVPGVSDPPTVVEWTTQASGRGALPRAPSRSVSFPRQRYCSTPECW